jgi:hypothetical protein
LVKERELFSSYYDYKIRLYLLINNEHYLITSLPLFISFEKELEKRIFYLKVIENQVNFLFVL